MKRSLKAMSALFGWTLIVTVMSLKPESGRDLMIFPHADKVMHFVFYGVMSFLAMHSVSRMHRITYAAVGICTGLYGLLIEWVQPLIASGRHFDYFDIIANIIGSLTGMYLFHLLRKNNHHG